MPHARTGEASKEPEISKNAHHWAKHKPWGPDHADEPSKKEDWHCNFGNIAPQSASASAVLLEEKEWENKSKGEVLEQLYDDNSGHLEAEADEETRVGSQFLDHQEKVKASVDGEDGGRRYKDQLDKIHSVVTNL